MEETPDTPDAADDAAPEDVGFGASERVLAGVLLIGVTLLGYVFMDVLAGGRITRALSAAPEGEQ